MELLILEEALASCALDGNKFAIDMLKLKRKDPKEYWKQLLELQKDSD